MKQLYGQAIVRDLSLRSIRDLRAKHVPMLRNLRQQCMTTLTQKYGVRPEHIFAYFHYQPSYYLLHVHFVHFAYDAAGSQACYRAHLLDVRLLNFE
jgi:m7GpppX diphosphatase